MKDFDSIINDKFGIIFGSRNLIFIKTDKGEDIYGPDNKYLEICISLSKHNGCTYVVSANQDEADLVSEIERIDEEVDDYDQIYYIGISDGGLIGAKQCWMVEKIEDAFLINVPLSLEDNFKDILNGVQKFQGNYMEFEFGEQDPSYKSVGKIEEINHTSIKCNKFGDVGHVFDIDTLEFAIGVFLNKQMYSSEKFIVTRENKKAVDAVKSAYQRAKEEKYHPKGYILYLFGEKGCGKTHLLNMQLNMGEDGIQIELDDAEDVHDYSEFLTGFQWNDLAMIDNVDRLDDEGIMILKEIIRYANCYGQIVILTSEKNPEETFTDKELISIIQQGVVVEILGHSGCMRSIPIDVRKEEILDLIKDKIIDVTRRTMVFKPIENEKRTLITDYGATSEIVISEDMVGGTLIIEDAYVVKTGKENDYYVISINESLESPIWGEVSYYIDNQLAYFEKYEIYEDFFKCIEKISKYEYFGFQLAPLECSSIEWLDCYTHVRLGKKETGLPYDVILDSSNLEEKLKILPHLCIDFEEMLVPILIDEEPNITLKTNLDIPDVGEILNWVSNHYRILLRHWNNELTDREVLNELVD